MNIKVNGREIDVEYKNLEELKRVLKYDDENIVTIINGFQSSENRELHKDDELFFIRKGQMPNSQELEYMIASRHTPRVHSKVKKAKVAIAGLGGLGSNVALILARTAVGHLHLVDFDIVEPSNLNRQQYRIKDLGNFKTMALKEQILDINPYINVTTENVRVTEDNVIDIFKDYPIVCEAFDNPESKAMLVNKLLTECPNIKIVSASGMAGYESSNSIVTKKIGKNFYICGDGVTSAKEGRGLMAPRVNICAGHESNMILRLILGEEQV